MLAQIRRNGPIAETLYDMSGTEGTFQAGHARVRYVVSIGCRSSYGHPSMVCLGRQGAGMDQGLSGWKEGGIIDHYSSVKSVFVFWIYYQKASLNEICGLDGE